MELVWQAEDSLREKKVESDLKDLLKTMVAFANSVAPGDIAQIFIGEKDDGEVQGVTDTDNIQKSVKKEADKIYPEIYYKTEVYERDGKSCVRVDIQHNGLAPHFGAPGWVRKGSETIKATAELYEQMISQRQSKIQELLKWVDKPIIVTWAQLSHGVIGPNWTEFPCRIIKVTQHFATFSRQVGQGPGLPQSEPIDWLDIGWHETNKCLQVYVSPQMKARPPW